MAGANLTRGYVIHEDGSQTHFIAGLNDQTRVCRTLGITTKDIEEGRVPVDYGIQLAYQALTREGKLQNVGYEAFLDTVFDMEIEADPESEAPPA